MKGKELFRNRVYCSVSGVVPFLLGLLLYFSHSVLFANDSEVLPTMTFESNKFYNNKIYVDASISRDLKVDEAVRVYKLAVGKLTGSPVTLSGMSDSAIRFISIEHSSLPSPYEKQFNESKQYFYVCEENGGINFTVNSSDGFTRAVYWLLAELGVEILGPTDDWIYFPEKLNTAIDFSERIVKPRIGSTTWSATGGHLGGGVYSKNDWNNQSRVASLYKNKQHWNNADYKTVGHSLSSFYKTKFKKIKAFQDKGVVIFHDWKGGKNKLARNFNLDEPRTQELINEFFLEKAAQKPNSFQIDISPMDGVISKQTLPTSIPEIKDGVDKWWWICNEAAKAVRAEYPNIKPAFNAYGNDEYIARTPSFPLISNCIVQIVPDAFQTAYKGRLNFYNAWKEKGAEDGFDQFYYRGYLNITQWSKGGLPQYDLDHHVKGLYHDVLLNPETEFIGFKPENTYMAVLFPINWAMSKVNNYGEVTDFDVLLERYYKLAFGEQTWEIPTVINGETQVLGFKNILTRWHKSRGYAGYVDMAFTARDIEAILKVTPRDVNDQYYRRIMLFSVYALGYLDRYYQCKDLVNKEPMWTKASLEMERYAKKYNHLNVMQTRAVVWYNYGNVKPWKYRRSPEDAKVGVDEGSTPFEFLEGEIYRDVKEIIARHPVRFEFVDFDGSEFNMKTQQGETIIERGYGRYSFVAPNEGNYVFGYRGDGGVMTITDSEFLIDEDEVVVSFDEINPDSQGWRLFELKNVRSNTLYNTTFKGKGQYKIPEELSLRWLGNRRPSGNRSNTFYVYVPEDADKIVWSGLLSTQKTKFDKQESFFLRPDGKDDYIREYYSEVVSEVANKATGKREGTYITKTFETDAKGNVIWDGRGKIWKVSMRIHTWKILNFERVISEKPFLYEEKYKKRKKT